MKQLRMRSKPVSRAIDLQPLIDSGLEEMLPELIEIFLETTPRTIEKARIAMGTSNAGGLAQAAHSLMGSCSNFGAGQLHELSQELENLGRSESLQTAAELLESIESEFIHVRAELLAYLEKAR